MNRHATPIPLSVRIAFTIGAQPLRCWRNAAQAVLQFPELFASGSYIEGWIVVPRRRSIDIIEHGWCVTSDGELVDPSVVLIERPDQFIIYFSGFEIPAAQLRGQIAGKIIPLVCNSEYGRDGMAHPGYRQSYERAWQRARDLAQKRHLPPEAITVFSRDVYVGVTIIVEC